MRRGLVLAVALLTVCPAASAAEPALSVAATPTDGPAPLRVTFTATGSSSAVHWDLGDGAQADGSTVEHTYAAGRWTVRATSGEASQALQIVAHGITLRGPQRVRYRRRATFRGAVIPAEAGAVVKVSGPGAARTTRTRRDGTFTARLRVKGPGTFVAATTAGPGANLAVSVIPQLRTGLVGSGARGSRFLLAARVRPAGAGRLGIQIRRGDQVLVDSDFGSRVRIKLDTRRLTTYRIRVAVRPADGYTGAVHLLRASVVLPRLSLGARSSSVAELAQRLRQLHYAAPATASFDGRMLDAVYAFQKVQGFPRTGVVDARFWRRLDDARIPVPRHARPTHHLEIDKTHQVLYVVRQSRVALVVPVSTAGLAGTYTPVGRFSIYRKVTGFDPSPLGTLYDPMYFTGGYAIHGNPSVPPFPASHGCVRVPMWLAPHLYATNPYGETVVVY